MELTLAVGSIFYWKCAPSPPRGQPEGRPIGRPKANGPGCFILTAHFRYFSGGW